MDMHVEMSYCTFEAFKMLATNYLGGVQDHPLFARVEQLLRVVDIAPADVAECLLLPQPDAPDSHHDGVDTCLGRLIEHLNKKAQEQKHKAAAKRPRRHRSSSNNN